VRSLARTVCVALLATGCGRSLEPGTYAFAVTSVRGDSCALEPRGDLALPAGMLEIAGDTVRIEFSPAGPLVPGLTGATGAKALVGHFLPDREVERFIADSSFDVVREIQGVSCVVFAHASIEARVESESRFAGTLRINYRRRAEAQPACLPGCVIEAEFTADRSGE
jgi:hypothetical protein